MRLVIEKSAMRGLNRMPAPAREGLRRRLDEIAADPFARHANVEPYKAGGRDSFRVRQGDWRAIYRLDRKGDVMRVQVIAPRGSVYR